MRKFISVTLALSLLGASVFALSGCEEDGKKDISHNTVTKTQYLQTLTKASQAFFGAHQISRGYTAQQNYENTKYGELSVTSAIEMKMSGVDEITYTDGETQKTVTLTMNTQAKADGALSVKKVGDYYYLRKTETAEYTTVYDDFDDETKAVYTETERSISTVQYDLGAYVNGETTTYYYAKNHTETISASSTDPDFTADEDNGVAQTEKVYKELTADEYYGAVLEVLEQTNETVYNLMVESMDTDGDFLSDTQEVYSKDANNLVLNISMFSIDEIHFDDGETSTTQGEGSLVINETGFVSTDRQVSIVEDSNETQLKLSIKFAPVAYTPLANLDGYTADTSLSFRDYHFSITSGLGF